VLLNSVVNKLAIADSLIVDSFGEEFVEVEVVFNEEADVARLELKGLVAKNFRVGENVEVKRT
jgi:hypothetical protein